VAFAALVVAVLLTLCECFKDDARIGTSPGLDVDI
jgi:hypothetical protein